LINAIQKIQDIREERLRSTAAFTLKILLFLSALFLIRALQWELYGRVLSLSLCIGFVWIGLFVLNKGGSRATAAILAIIGACITVSYASYSSGGLSNPAAGWLAILPLIGALVGGRQGGIFAFFFSLATGLCLFALEFSLGAPENLTPVDFRLSQDRLNQVSQLMIVSISVFGLFRQISFSENQLTDTVIKLSKEVDARTLAEQQYKNASNIKSEFLANMSHEIRTPMNGIIGMLNILRQEPLTHSQKKYLELARSSSNTLLVVINDILDLNKIESGKLVLENIDFDLFKLIDDIQKITLLSAHEKKLYFNCNIDLCSHKVHGDPVRLRQVIDNLISNALKFTPTGGISLTVSLVPKNEYESLLSISIDDTGIGITQEKISQLFTPFLQMEASSTKRHGGTGLGLTISNQLINLMKGSIEVSSTEGKGSSFNFTIDLVTPEFNTNKTIEIEANKNKEIIITKDHYLPVLLVEDNEINIIIAQALLENFPLKVDVAKNGVQAIEMLQQNKESSEEDYKAVFMDCQMPEMDGYQATVHLREQDEYKNLPIIAMTANAIKGDKEKCLDAGMSDYISKPIELTIIAEKLLKWLKVNPL
jgi:signal transduction histidine kinase/ActR/RegA family two-component response regulator